MTYAAYHKAVRRWMLIGMLFITSFLTVCAPANAGAHGGYQGFGEDEYAWTYPKDYPLDTQEDSFAQSGTDKAGPNLSVRLVDREPDHYADVIFYNVLAHSFYTPPQINFIRPDGKIVRVYFTMKAGEEPDMFTVIPPKGYIAIPQDLVVPEDSEGTIEIHEYTGG